MRSKELRPNPCMMQSEGRSKDKRSSGKGGAEAVIDKMQKALAKVGCGQ